MARVVLSQTNVDEVCFVLLASLLFFVKFPHLSHDVSIVETSVERVWTISSLAVSIHFAAFISLLQPNRRPRSLSAVARIIV